MSKMKIYYTDLSKMNIFVLVNANKSKYKQSPDNR
jgi:hypothetical protein